MEILQRIITGDATFKNKNLNGRYIKFQDIVGELDELSEKFLVETIGKSVLKTPIKSVTFGQGPIKILAWSQMHGNETTTTKAVFDIFAFFETYSNETELREIEEKCTIKVIPMLNPDGAARYTRENINNIDLNRDAQKLEQPESRILRRCFDDFEPHFCFNLHDQRTIFGVGNSGKPATLAFLAPAIDNAGSVPENREKAMQLIVGLARNLDKMLPGQISRFSDSFNIDCTGDTFQSLKVPTVLFEAGHYPKDYSRELTRKYVFLALFEALRLVASRKLSEFLIANYFKIPENKKNFYDVVLENAVNDSKKVAIAIQFQEKVKGEKITFAPIVVRIAKRIPEFAYQKINCEGKKVTTVDGGSLNENDLVYNFLLNSVKIEIKGQ